MNRDEIRAALVARSKSARTRAEVVELQDADGRPLVAYFRPINTQDIVDFGHRIQQGDMLCFAELFVRKAESKDGTSIFEEGDHEWLVNYLEPQQCARLLVYVAPQLVDTDAGRELESGSNGDARSAGIDDFEETVGNSSGTDTYAQ